jgi:hypothetical protein
MNCPSLIHSRLNQVRPQVRFLYVDKVLLCCSRCGLADQARLTPRIVSDLFLFCCLDSVTWRSGFEFKV